MIQQSLRSLRKGAASCRSERRFTRRPAASGIWRGLSSNVASRRDHCGQYPQGRETRRHPDRAGDEVHDGRQPQDRQSARPQHPVDRPRRRRRGNRMRRREFIAGGVLAALAARASAQTPPATRRLAVFEPAVPAASWRRGSFGGAAMLDQLARRKYVEGDNLRVEIYGTEDDASGMEAMARRVVATKPDVVFVGGVGGTLFQRMTTTIPIVVLSTDLVGQGLVQSLAHPGGNITGVAVDTGPAVWGNTDRAVARNGPGD